MKNRLYQLAIAVIVLGIGVGDAMAQPASNPIPTVSEWGMIVLGGGLVALGARAVARRKTRKD